MSRRRPRSTLFPYTALFRSAQLEREHARVRIERDDQLVAVVLAQRLEPRRHLLRRGHDEHREVGAALRHGFIELADRKSTRLNSSHANISYAVFCLKKKP